MVTAGGATSFLSLALHVVERLLGGEVARGASKMFLIDPNKSPRGVRDLRPAEGARRRGDPARAGHHRAGAGPRGRDEAAKRVLERTRQPVAAVAYEVGYEDVVAFRRMFTRLTGRTPSAYRARYGAAEPGTLVAPAG